MSESIAYNMDCMEIMATLPDKALLNRFENAYHLINVFKVALPHPHHLKPDRFSISILRDIKVNSLFLACIKQPVRHIVPVPIIPVKLNYSIFARHKRVNCEFTVNNILRYIVNLKRIEETIRLSFKSVWKIVALVGVHLHQAFLKLWAFITAFNRAIPLVGKARGTDKFFPANRANKVNFVSRLIFVGAFTRTGCCCACPTLRNIKLNPTIHARFVYPVLDFISWLMCVVTFGRTKLNTFGARFSNEFAATSTIKFPDSVFHMLTSLIIFSAYNITQNPVAVNGWHFDKDYFEAQEKRFQAHIAQSSLFVEGL